MGDDIVPPYAPSSPSPCYSSELLPGEQTVEFSRRDPSRLPTGAYRRITDLLTIVLRDQHPGVVYPTYNRGGFIQGDVILNTGNMVDITSVTLKLEGHFLLHASGPVPVPTTFLSVAYVLWSACHAQRCPQTIPFRITFPLTFHDGGQLRALPPTFQSSKPRATCSYSLTIELLRPRRVISFLKGTEAVKVPLTYHPRHQPHLPMLPSDLLFMSTVKSSPEEWHEVMCTVPMTQGSGLAHVECLLFVPSVRTFASSDTIPFHVQIHGSRASLIPFLEQDQSGCQARVVIRVYLLRQTNVRMHGQFATTSRNLGEGKITPSHLEHRSHSTCVSHPGEGLDTLDWDGVLRFDEDVIIPSFSTNQLSVKDFIVLSITPRQPLASPLLSVTHSCPIRLATDPWSDDYVTY